MRIVLKGERLAYVLESPTVDASKEVQRAYLKNIDDKEMVGCIMLSSMSLELQKEHEDMNLYTIVCDLREFFYKLLFRREGTTMYPSSSKKGSKNKMKGISIKGKEV